MSDLPSTPKLVLLPAIDVADGQAVRLTQGEAGSETSYGDPVDAAADWTSQGAEWIHLVDLDAAFGRGNNHEVIRSVIKRVGGDALIELSGGIRDDASLEAARDTGAKRINLGTAALENPEWAAQVIAKFGDLIAVGLDVRGTTLAARGWTKDGGDLFEVLDRLDELVIKPVDGSGGKGLVVGPAASPAELEKLRKTLLADPRGWIAQPVVQLSTIPTLVEDGMRPRHADLRPFAVNDGKDVWVLPGGLTRVALPEGELVVNSSQGGGSKDTWVVGENPLQVSRHSIQGLVADQASAMEAVPIINSEVHYIDQAPRDRTLGQAQQEQQQQGPGLALDISSSPEFDDSGAEVAPC